MKGRKRAGGIGRGVVLRVPKDKFMATFMLVPVCQVVAREL